MHPGHLKPLPPHCRRLGFIVQYITLRPFVVSPNRLCLLARYNMPRRKGSVNYKNDVLIQIISEIFPSG